MKIMNFNSFKEAKDIFQYPKFSMAYSTWLKV